MGYTTLRAFARALDRRAKYTYALLVLDICVAILALRNDINEKRKLRRELCVIAARQSDDRTCHTHCKLVLADLYQHFECGQDNKDTLPVAGWGKKHHAIDSFVTQDIHEFQFTTELLVKQNVNACKVRLVNNALLEIDTTLSKRHRLCATNTTSQEFEIAIQHAALFATYLLAKQCDPVSASHCLRQVLTTRPASSRRRIATLSHYTETEVLCGNAVSAHTTLRRIERLRLRQPGLASRKITHQPKLLWEMPIRGGLVSFCEEGIDLGKLSAQVALLGGQAKTAWRTLGPTVAAVESVVSRAGCVQGLYELGALYELKGQAQVAMKNEVRQSPSRVDDSCGAVCHRQQPNIVNAPTRRKMNSSVTNGVSLCSRSHHYCDPVGAPRWYRQALECFKAIDDYFGVAHAAAAFASTSLGVVFAETTTRQKGQQRSADEIDVAAHHALELAAVISEPLLLLDAYLNVAESRYIQDDPLSSIAHWWEAREILLRLFVDGVFVPLVPIAAYTVLEKLRLIFERLLRLLAAVADRAMINENLMLFDIFVIFERDVRRRSTRPLITYHNANSRNKNHKHVDSLSCWRCLVRMHANVSHHRLGNLNLYKLQGRNRGALREFAAGMRRLRCWSADCIIKNFSCVPAAYAIHAANSLIVYAPHLGWRHMITFGHFNQGLDAVSASLVGAFAGTRRVRVKMNKIEHRRCIIKRIAHMMALPHNFFSALTFFEDRNGSFITLVCSERAHVLPWECFADTAVSRILCASDVINKHFPTGLEGSHQHTRTGHEVPKWCRTSPECLSSWNSIDEAPMHIAFEEMKHVIDTLVADLAQSPCDEEGHFLPLYPNMTCLRNDQPLGTRRVKARLSSEIIDNNTPSCKVIPLSLLYAPRDDLLTQAMGKEVFCVPDPLLSHITASLDAQRSCVKLNWLAKALSDELAVPIVHLLNVKSMPGVDQEA